MRPILSLICLLLPLYVLAAGPGLDAADTPTPLTDWDVLIPPGQHPTRILERHGVRFLDLAKARGQAIFEELERARRLAPVVSELDGRAADLRGFVVPLDGDGEATTEFLLVPDTGYCIHMPLPPANQVVLVRAPDSGQAWALFSEVQVRGRLRVEERALPNGRAGYALEAQDVVRAP